MLPVVSELVKRGDEVRFYSFNEFEEKIKKTGAEFISCDPYLLELSEKSTGCTAPKIFILPSQKIRFEYLPIISAMRYL